MNIIAEQMNDTFEKFHIDLGSFKSSFHHFTGPDVGDPHDHPADFKTHILRGGYIEEIYEIDSFGDWYMRRVTRYTGESHLVKATAIHRIIRLLDGECWTCVDMAEHYRKTKFYKFDCLTGVFYRDWDSDEWKPYNRNNV